MMSHDPLTHHLVGRTGAVIGVVKGGEIKVEKTINILSN